MSLILDSGALIAFERGSKTVQTLIERAQLSGEPVRTTTGVVAQVWRNPAKQARVALLLRGVEEVALDSANARATGLLLAKAGAADVTDASLVELARDNDEILTSDPDDLEALAEASGKSLTITPV